MMEATYSFSGRCVPNFNGVTSQKEVTLAIVAEFTIRLNSKLPDI
jgi:hypothetical protein